jgi:hypothetical protein
LLPEAETMSAFHMLAGAADDVRLALSRMGRRRSDQRQAANGEQSRAKTG